MEKTTDVVREQLIEDEYFQILKAGELPEIAYHSAIYHLTQDPEGPKLELTPEEISRFKCAVVECYKEIIFRDITPENRDKRKYRGLQRAYVNITRLTKFCDRENIKIDDIISEISHKALFFLENEIKDCCSGKPSCINCSYETLKEFAERLNILHLIPEDIQKLCKNE